MEKSLQLQVMVNAMNRDSYFKLRSNLKVVKDLKVPEERKKEDRL
jgi:hypothetical protein